MPLYCSLGHENDSNNRFCCNCGQRLPLAVGQTLEKRYRLISHLGQGGFGRTYLAEALYRFGDRCVLKEFAPQVTGTAELVKAKELFHREAGALHKLKHPQLPGFWELFQVDLGAGNGCLFFVQDYIEGQTYFDLLKSGMCLNEAEIRQFLEQMLEVLAYIHSQGVIHRDISPDNIILRNSDHLPVLIDFGGVKQIAVSATSQLSHIGKLPTRLGKKGYAPEEQLRQGKVFFNSDLYSLAVTTLVLLTGKEPQDLYDIYQGNWRWETEIKVSSPLKTVLQKMLAYQVGDRFLNAQEVLQHLSTPQPLIITNPSTKPNTQPINLSTTPYPLSPSISKVSRMLTLVFAPKAQTAPIIARANPSKPVAPKPFIKKPSFFLNNLASLILKLTFGTGIVLVTSWAGWAVMNSVIRSTKLDFVTNPQKTPTNSPNYSTEKRAEKIFNRRQTLGISEIDFNDQVNQKFYAKHPELKGRALTNSPEDAEFREEWYAIAEAILR